MIFYGWVVEGEVKMIRTDLYPGWVALPGWHLLVRAPRAPGEPLPDKVLWDGTSLTVVPR